MGIPHDVATDALNRTNGNLEAAVNFIFTNELPPDTGNNNPEVNTNKEGKYEQIELVDQEQFNPGDLTNVIPVSNEASNFNVDSINYNSYSYSADGDYNDEDSSSDEQLGNSISDNLAQASYQIVKHVEHKSQLTDPTVILPLPPNSLIENYFGLYSLCVAMYLPQVLMKPDFIDLNYNENWFRGTEFQAPKYCVTPKDSETGNIKIAVSADLSDEYDQPELLWQLQKLAAIANCPLAERAYVSAKLFTLILNQRSQAKLAEAEHLYEILPTFIKYLVYNSEISPNQEVDEMKDLLISSAFYVPSNDEPTVKTLLSLFHFLPEEYDSTLYRMFNVLLYPDEEDDDDDESEGVLDHGNSLSYISPMLTIIFDEVDESSQSISLPEGVDVPLEFYPQLYTKECKDQLIRHIISKRKDAQTQSKEILRDLNSLKSHQGKDILKFINSSLEYLDKDKKPQELIDGLSNIKDQLAQKKSGKMNSYKDLAQKLHGQWNLTHPEAHIVGTAKALGLIKEPYLLIMVVLLPYLYYIRERDGTWSLVNCSISGDNFDVRKCSSELEVQDAIKQSTRRASETPIMFMYCRKDMIPDEQVVLKAIEQNKGASAFVKADQMALNKNTNVDSS